MKCPECHAQTIRARAPIWKMTLGALLIFVAVLAFMPTFAASTILAVYGLYLWVGDRHCAACDWTE